MLIADKWVFGLVTIVRTTPWNFVRAVINNDTGISVLIIHWYWRIVYHCKQYYFELFSSQKKLKSGFQKNSAWFFASNQLPYDRDYKGLVNLSSLSFQLYQHHSRLLEPYSTTLQSWIYMRNIFRLCREPLFALPYGSRSESEDWSWMFWQNIRLEFSEGNPIWYRLQCRTKSLSRGVALYYYKSTL